MVGGVDFMDRPALAFVRLKQAVTLGNDLDVEGHPTHFIFLLVGPMHLRRDFHEVSSRRRYSVCR